MIGGVNLEYVVHPIHGYVVRRLTLCSMLSSYGSEERGDHMAVINKLDNSASISYGGNTITSNTATTLLLLAPTIGCYAAVAAARYRQFGCTAVRAEERFL